jgi:hypothetical protein
MELAKSSDGRRPATGVKHNESLKRLVRVPINDVDLAPQSFEQVGPPFGRDAVAPPRADRRWRHDADTQAGKTIFGFV